MGELGGKREKSGRVSAKGCPIRSPILGRPYRPASKRLKSLLTITIQARIVLEPLQLVSLGLRCVGSGLLRGIWMAGGVVGNVVVLDRWFVAGRLVSSLVGLVADSVVGILVGLVVGGPM
ncbi:hypothetical protein CRG98_044260 [Punica granatum]|uniref:Uncharacterized protein n=1 Tax=Punica granatum TaxID=22663 RepID=A0A2I0HVP0_PUNGR|nr:hypothetical protein CRG98_044260 [Punica granatum]